MDAADILRGACSCGRYNYIVNIPKDRAGRDDAYVHFGTGNIDRRSHASILSAWLRVPISWYQSTTVSFFPDETHDHIARTFRPVQEPGSQRKFCGFCGTHVSYWTEQPRSEQHFMNITLGSLRERDLLALEDLDMLPADVNLKDESRERERPSGGQNAVLIQAGRQAHESSLEADGALQTTRHGRTGGISWFEDMIEGSQLGHHSKRRLGQGTSVDGTTVIQWDVTEYIEDNEATRNSSSAPSKRKAGDLESDDVKME